jgi:hypothetical protein
MYLGKEKGDKNYRTFDLYFSSSSKVHTFTSSKEAEKCIKGHFVNHETDLSTCLKQDIQNYLMQIKGLAGGRKAGLSSGQLRKRTVYVLTGGSYDDDDIDECIDAIGSLARAFKEVGLLKGQYGIEFIPFPGGKCPEQLQMLDQLDQVEELDVPM